MGSGPPLEVTLRLLSVEQLFVPPPPERLPEADMLDSGMDELLSQLRHRPLKRGLRTTFFLPRSEIAPDAEVRIRAAIARYCQLRARRSENEFRLVKRDGMRALMLGGPVAAIALALSAVVFGDPVRDAGQIFFGEGLLLVIAWVALWYPVETLLISGRPFVRERKLLATVQEMDIVVLPSD